MVIINPKAGDESSGNLKLDIVEHLKQYFEQIIVKETGKQGEAELFAEEACLDQYEAICSVGGDGTVNEIFRGLFKYEQRPKIAIIPGGTGNILSRLIGVSVLKHRAIKSFDFERSKLIDVGVCNGRVFNLFASIGPVSDAMHEVSSEEKKKLGLFAYIKSSMENLANSEVYQVEIETDAGTYTGNVDHVVISLSNRLGDLKFTEENKSLSNGKANVFILKNNQILPRLSTFTNVLLGQVERTDEIEHFIASKIKIKSLDEKEILVDLDGEEGPTLPVEIEILQQQIEVYLPATYKE